MQKNTPKVNTGILTQQIEPVGSRRTSSASRRTSASDARSAARKVALPPAFSISSAGPRRARDQQKIHQHAPALFGESSRHRAANRVGGGSWPGPQFVSLSAAMQICRSVFPVEALRRGRRLQAHAPLLRSAVPPVVGPGYCTNSTVPPVSLPAVLIYQSAGLPCRRWCRGLVLVAHLELAVNNVPQTCAKSCWCKGKPAPGS